MKANVYLPDDVFIEAKARGINLSRTLRDALTAQDPPVATPVDLIASARYLCAEARRRRAQGPIHLLLTDLADALEAIA